MPIILSCPECAALAVELAAHGRVGCTACGVAVGDGSAVLNFLPKLIDSLEVKESERSGWDALVDQAGTPWAGAELPFPVETYLALPYLESFPEPDPYYQQAAVELRAALAWLGPLAGFKVLDLGGAIGWGAYRFAEAGAEVVLADYNDSPTSGLGVAKVYFQKVGAFPRIRVDAERLPFAEGQFDVVWSSSFLHHLTDIPSALAGIHKSLRPGGIYFAACEAFLPPWLSTDAAHAENEEVRRYRSLGINEQVYPQDRWIDWFEAAGFGLRIVQPRWDRITRRQVEYGSGVRAPGYLPEILDRRRNQKGGAGLLARGLLRSGLWRVSIPLLQSEQLRRLLLRQTRKPRFLLAQKPG